MKSVCILFTYVHAPIIFYLLDCYIWIMNLPVYSISSCHLCLLHLVLFMCDCRTWFPHISRKFHFLPSFSSSAPFFVFYFIIDLWSDQWSSLFSKTWTTWYQFIHHINLSSIQTLPLAKWAWAEYTHPLHISIFAHSHFNDDPVIKLLCHYKTM